MLRKSQLGKGKSKPLSRTPLKSKGGGLKKSSTPIGGKKTLKSGIRLKKSRVKTEEELLNEQMLRDKRTAFYEQCIEVLGVRSYISGKKINNPGRGNYHHTKPKAKYRDIEFSFNVILVVTLDEHSMVESDMEAFEENVEKIKWIEENYEQCKKESREFEENYEKLKGI